MLTVAALVALVGWMTATAFVLTRLVDAVEARRFRRIAAQVRVTEAVHAKLGAVVAPTVARHGNRSWSVTMGLEPAQLAMAGSLTEVALLALESGSRAVEVVFVPRPSR
jgi:hypothetical protein